MKTVTLLPEHWSAVRRIYEDGLATGNASFQTSAPSWEQWDKGHLPHSRLVALDDSAGVSPVVAGSAGVSPVVGWAALSPVSARPVYAGVAEVSIYIDQAYRGKGIGLALMAALIEESEANGIWTLQAGIFPENEASIQLHLRSGFRKIGFREKIGEMGDRWRDTALLERRSQKY